jgi:hypothetical protein
MYSEDRYNIIGFGVYWQGVEFTRMNYNANVLVLFLCFLDYVFKQLGYNIHIS